MKMMMLLMLAGTQIFALGAHADICAWAPDMDLAKFNQALAGKVVSPEAIADTTVNPNLPPQQGKVIGIFLMQQDNTAIDLQMSKTGVYDQTEQTFMDADLGHFNLVCDDGKGNVTYANLAGSMKNSGMMCVGPSFVANIPSSPVDLNCKPINAK